MFYTPISVCPATRYFPEKGRRRLIRCGRRWAVYVLLAVGSAWKQRYCTVRARIEVDRFLLLLLPEMFMAFAPLQRQPTPKHPVCPRLTARDPREIRWTQVLPTPTPEFSPRFPSIIATIAIDAQGGGMTA